MKYTLHGFNQRLACKMNLSNDDLAILRWFIDFKDTKKMQHKEIDGKVYYWVVYNKVLEDLPILKCNVRTIANKFKNLENAGILMHKTFKVGGTFSYYGVGDMYTLMLSDDCIFDGSQSNDEGVDKKTTKGSQSNDEGVDKKLSYKDYSINDSSINYSSIKNNTLDDFFESIWKMYPKKKGKGQVSKSQKKKLFDIGLDEMTRCLERVNKYYTDKKTEEQFMQQGSTFFNTGYLDYLDCNYADTEKKAEPIVIEREKTQEELEREKYHGYTIEELRAFNGGVL